MSTEIFVSYAHEDERYLEDDSLLGHLKGVEKDGAHFWDDRRLKPGELWDERIKTQLKQADIALALVSQNFLLSDYCQNTEISEFLDRTRKGGGMFVFPVLLSACDWQQYDWLKSRQLLPKNGKNIAQHFYQPEGKRRAMFQTITDALRERVREIERQKQDTAPPHDTAIEAASKSVNIINKLFPEVRSFSQGGDDKKEEAHGVVFEGKGDRIIANNYGSLTTFTADDLKKLQDLSERELRHIILFQRDLEECSDRWEVLYRRRRAEPADVRRETEREMRQLIADMKESLGHVFSFLGTAQLHIDDHYLLFLDLVERESRRAEEAPAA